MRTNGEVGRRLTPARLTSRRRVSCVKAGGRVYDGCERSTRDLRWLCAVEPRRRVAARSIRPGGSAGGKQNRDRFPREADVVADEMGIRAACQYESEGLIPHSERRPLWE